MRNVYIRIMKNLIKILLYEDYKSSFSFFPPEIFMPVYFSFFLALSLIIFENLVFLFFSLFFLHFFFLSFLFIFLFYLFIISQSAYFSNKKPPQPCRDDLYMYFLFLFFLLIFPESFFFFEVL